MQRLLIIRIILSLLSILYIQLLHAEADRLVLVNHTKHKIFIQIYGDRCVSHEDGEKNYEVCKQIEIKNAELESLDFGANKKVITTLKLVPRNGIEYYCNVIPGTIIDISHILTQKKQEDAIKYLIHKAQSALNPMPMSMDQNPMSTKTTNWVFFFDPNSELERANFIGDTKEFVSTAMDKIFIQGPYEAFAQFNFSPIIYSLQNIWADTKYLLGRHTIPCLVVPL